MLVYLERRNDSFFRHVGVWYITFWRFEEWQMKTVNITILARGSFVMILEKFQRIVLQRLGADTFALPQSELLQWTVLTSFIDECLRDCGDGRHDVDLGVSLGSGLPASRTWSRTKESEEHREEEHAVEQAQDDDEEDHLGEGDDHITGMINHWYHTQNGSCSSWQQLLNKIPFLGKSS